ncbi:riboflavin synthase [bacterium]|nr:riboflavin synthase [bacterium]
MFTGIVQEIGKIQSIQSLKSGIALEITSGQGPFSLGESISVDGACLTVTQAHAASFWCELSPETLERTTARQYRLGSRVNLERALAVGDRLGGHWVTGHVDSVLTLSKKEVFNDFWKLTFSHLPETLRAFFVEKGSVALNGVSLTLNHVDSDGFDVMIIPHTLEKTTLQFLEPGNTVNLEVDWMSKIIVQTVERILKGKV